MKNKSSIGLIIIGVLNLIHASMHIIQLVQSILIVSYSLNHNENSWVHKLFESPIFAFASAIVAIATIVIGWRDYKHHKHEDEK